MKIKNSDDKKVLSIEENDAKTSKKQDINVSNMEEMEVNGNDVIDNLQAKTYNSGIKTLKSVKDENLVESINEKAYDNAVKMMSQVKGFNLNVGFAGEQSSGKSMVINSLLQYPLMPTCNLTTTCTVVKLIYGEKVRIIATDDDTKKRVFDLDCAKVTSVQFDKLKEYAILAMRTLVVENLQYFTDVDVKQEANKMTVDDISDMDSKDPKQVALLLLVLLSVYVGQNDIEMTEDKQKLMQKRKAYMKYFGIPENTYNLSVTVQWDNEFLKKGFTITDLPGLGAAAHEKVVNGKKIKSHDEITCEAIFDTDAMVLLTDHLVKNTSFLALEKMIEKLKQKAVVDKESRIIPVLNKADCLGQAQLETSLEKYHDILIQHGVDIKKEDIRPYAAIFGEYKYTDISPDRLLYVKDSKDYVRGRKSAQEIYEEDLKEDYEVYSRIEELLIFFRSQYIETGKYSKIKSAIHSMRGLKNDAVSNLIALVNKYDSYMGIQASKAKEISGKLQTIVNTEISKGIKKVENDTKYVKKENDRSIKSIDDNTGKYILAFEKALDAYKKEINSIINQFDLAFIGFSNKARIDRYGDRNYTLYYDKLCPALQTMDVELSDVNDTYTDILKGMCNVIVEVYDTAIKELDTLKEDVNKEVISLIENEKEDDSVLSIYKSLGKTVVDLLEQKIQFAKTSAEQLKSDVIAAGKEVAEAMSKENDRMVDEFVSNITDSVKGKITNGSWFSSREYLEIDGDTGLKTVVDNIYLSDDEKDNIKLNIEATGAGKIINKIGEWVDKAYSISQIYHDIRDKITELLKETDEDAFNSIDKLTKLRDEAKAKAEKWESIFDVFAKDIQVDFNSAVDYMKDLTIDQRHKENIMSDIH